VTEKRSVSKRQSDEKRAPVSFTPFNVAEGDLWQRIMELPDPREAVRHLSRQDYYWLVKKMDDQRPLLLVLGSEQQWQHLLDMDVWNGDRIDGVRLEGWVEQFMESDPERFVPWFLTDGLFLAYRYLYGAVEVITIDPADDDGVEVPEGFFSIDSVIFVRPRDEELYPAVRSLLETMADFDQRRYEWVLMTLGGIIPAEMEEEMYHFRKARLADDGFLPFNEALEIYAPLDPADLGTDRDHRFIDSRPDMEEDDKYAVPRLPLAHAGSLNLLGRAMERISDTATFDRLCFEFAGLGNRIVVADGLTGRELEELTTAGGKAAAYVSLALEELYGGDEMEAEKALRLHPLSSLFRVGYGFVADIAREARRFVGEGWFREAGIATSFWGEPEDSMLSGLLAGRPKFYDMSSDHAGYREFEYTRDLESCRAALDDLLVLDRLFAQLDRAYPLDRNLAVSPGITFRQLLLTFFARMMTGAEPGYFGLSPSSARQFLELARRGESGPPYRMSRLSGEFATAFTPFMENETPRRKEMLGNVLASVWREFQEEYEMVAGDDLKARYSRLILIEEPEK
jgi:hypothetical protein